MISPFGQKAAGFILAVSLFGSSALAAEGSESVDAACMVETSAWMLANFLPDPGDFYQLCFGYQLDEKNVLLLNGITWKYGAPLGIAMFDPSFDSPDEDYPGYVRAFGLGLGYQRFVWKDLFAALYAIPFAQDFYTREDEYIQSGFQLYLQVQMGYQFDIGRGRFFLKPAIYMNYWPIDTNFPEAFRLKEEKWPSFQPFEPHLNFGFRF